MKKVLFFSAIALCAMMVSCNKAEKPAEAEKQAIEANASVEVSALRAAEALAKYGYDAPSASALIEAANILASTPFEELKAEEVNPGESTEMGDKAEQEPMSAAKLIADAKAMTDDATLLAMAAKVEEKLAAGEGVRGSVGGPDIAYGRVYAHDYNLYYVTFYGNQFAEVAVSGDGDTDLDLYVYDANGNLIGCDVDYTDDCYVSWVPAWTGQFQIKVVNRGNVYNNFVIAVN